MTWGLWLVRPPGRLNLPVNHHAAALVQTIAGRLGSTMREITDIEEFQQVLNDAKASNRPVVVQVSGTSSMWWWLGVHALASGGSATLTMLWALLQPHGVLHAAESPPWCSP